MNYKLKILSKVISRTSRSIGSITPRLSSKRSWWREKCKKYIIIYDHFYYLPDILLSENTFYYVITRLLTHTDPTTLNSEQEDWSQEQLFQLIIRNHVNDSIIVLKIIFTSMKRSIYFSKIFIAL
jgi:hypothetical protein